MFLFLAIYTGFAQPISKKDTSGLRMRNTDVSITVEGDKQIQEIVYTIDSVTYSFKSDKVIDFSSHTNVIIPEGATISLIETRGNKTIEAELRVKNNDYRLLLIREGTMSEYYSSEDEWLTNFLKVIVRSQQNNPKGITKCGISGSASVITVSPKDSMAKENVSMDAFLNVLKNLKMEQTRMELLSDRINKGINIKDQKKIIGFIFGNFMMEDNKVKLLGQLIDNPLYVKANNDYLLSFIDQLQMESNKVLLLKKLLK
jgi:hypothetical protein